VTRVSHLAARLAIALAVVTAALAAPWLDAAAHAADPPNTISIKGTGLSQAISVPAPAQPDLFAALLRQVSWMAGQAGDPIQPDPTKLGPGYTLTVYVGTAASAVYDLYPQAPGGPRAHRPAAQPTGTTTEAWFYASVAMPDMLAAAGVPLIRPSASGPSSGLAYGDPVGYVPAVAAASTQSVSLGRTLHSSERTLLLWLATPFVVIGLLFLAARRARRYGRG
jgi:hypothetical protein